MEKKKLVAISKDEAKVFIVKNVNEQEYNRLLNKQNECESLDEIAKARQLTILDEHKNAINKLYKRDVILAKSVYDNFVDRGLIENDDAFQQMWYDYYFNDKELDLANSPQEYKTILIKVGNLQ